MTKQPTKNFDTSLLLAAEKEAKQSNQKTIAVLQSLMGLDQLSFLDWLGQYAGYRVLTMSQLNEYPADFNSLPFAQAVQRDILPLRDQDGHLLLIISDPFSDHLREWARANISETFTFQLAHFADIQAFFVRQETSERALQHWARDEDILSVNIEDAEVISLKTIAEDTSDIVRLVNSTLYDALKFEASDIHLETSSYGLVIKYRIDGVLSLVNEIPGIEVAEQVISRLKVISELDIAERRIPQDGRFKILTGGRSVDFRVSIMPSIYGEDAVLRILDKQNLTNQINGLRLDVLGFDSSTLSTLRKLIREPYGMLLVTGPTGSGKTTTLYAAISEINEGHEKIITIEDPVEYQLPGILQIPVNEKKGLTFARGLRSILRHDPDKIMVGEIRDPETAQIAIQSALTGHLVFTTVHANNVFDVLGRFLHMGVDAYSFVSSLNAIVAQRLVRTNCKECAVATLPDDELLANSGINKDEVHQFNFFAGKGCGHCRGTGFKGRKAIAELLIMNDELREMIANRQSIKAIKEAAVRFNTKFLRESALELVKNGETTLQEINRVTFVS